MSTRAGWPEAPEGWPPEMWVLNLRIIQRLAEVEEIQAAWKWPGRVMAALAGWLDAAAILGAAVGRYEWWLLTCAAATTLLAAAPHARMFWLLRQARRDHDRWGEMLQPYLR